MAERGAQGDHARQAGEDRPARPPCSARTSTRASSTRPRAPTSPRAAAAPPRRLGRGEVSMTTAKAWKQKGTGRARAGALSVPHRRGGGVAFGPKPRTHTFKVNRKARRRALRSAFSVHAARDSIAVLDGARLRDAVDQAGRRGARPSGARRGRPWSSATRRRPASLKSFRNMPEVDVLPVGSAGRRRRDRPRLADRHRRPRSRRSRPASARSSAATEHRRRSRGGGELDGRSPGDHRAGRLARRATR